MPRTVVVRMRQGGPIPHASEVRYAIGCVGMFRQVQSDEFLRAIRLVCAAAETISRAIGYHG